MPLLRRLVTILLFVPAVCLLSPSRAQADQLTYYVYPSPLGINWSTPSSLIWSAFANEALDGVFPVKDAHTIGHVNFDLQCDSGIRIVTGQTNSDDGQMTDYILKQGYGLEAMLTKYSGRWETKEEIEKDRPEHLKLGMIAFIHFQISPQTCARVADYLREYQERGYDKVYAGLGNLPRYGQGAGCSAFGEGVLEIAGLMPAEWQRAWKHSLYVPNELIGGPGTGRHVSVFDGLFGPHSGAWNSTPEDSFALTFWDPGYMYRWIQRAWRKPTPVTGMTYKRLKRGKARGLAIDATALPTPTDPYWLDAPLN